MVASPRWALCNAYPENNAQGGLRHVVLTFIDITSLKNAQAEQKHLQAQLAQSQKMEALGTLAGAEAGAGGVAGASGAWASRA